MKKTVTRVFALAAIILAISGLAACEAHSAQPLAAGEITAENVSQVCEILENAGLSNVDIFEQWVTGSGSNGTAESDSAPTETDDISVGFTDADCRMTVMLLAGDQIEYDSLNENYDGTYLMFDLDAIENQPEFSILQDKKTLFTTMFGETDIPDSGLADALPDNWKEHGIRFDNESCTIISLVFSTYEGDQAFVGHTGLLVNCKNSKNINTDYIFIEKIAFGDPFRITPVRDEAELISVFSQRPDYFVEEGEPAPVVCRNGEAIGTLE